MFRRRKNPIGIGPRFVPGRAGGRALRGRMGAISSFQGCVLQPLESIVETICPTRIRKVQPGEKVAPQPPAENIHERLGAICGGGMPAATPQDARHLLLLVRRILHEAREREIDTQEVRRLNEVAGRMRQRFLARRGAVNSRTAASGNDKILQMTVGELVRGARDVTIQIMDRPKGSGIKIERYAMAAGGPGDPHDNRRGPNLGGLTIRNGFANNLYYVHPDRETIEFRPYVGEKGKKYRISIGQREAWKIVNRQFSARGGCDLRRVLV